MIVHSVGNEIDGYCLVQVEGIHPFTSEIIVRLFAQGAAGALNRGEVVANSRVAHWLDESGRPIADGFDTSQSRAAQVLCQVDAP